MPGTMTRLSLLDPAQPVWLGWINQKNIEVILGLGLKPNRLNFFWAKSVIGKTSPFRYQKIP
jgi:hypothetical protein